MVGIGASAGGLEACGKLIGAVPADSGMAFVLVQHLDPTHESMMVSLLASHAAMPVDQATDGMLIEPDHLYVIPPGHYLSVNNGALHLSPPQIHHGVRLPFDFLLSSLATEYGPRAIAIILSGTGADGSLGLVAVKEKGGLIIAQNPEEAGYDGMPRNAILSGMVDLVLPVDAIPRALAEHCLGRTTFRPQRDELQPPEVVRDWLPEIIELLRTRTPHDFTHYKQGTLRRRIERRMTMAAIPSDGMAQYLDLLRSDAPELDLLANDLLINVTSFFRDPEIFDTVAKTIVPELIRNHTSGQPLRLWVAGCSTGEEAYSLAMVFFERITVENRHIKLLVFASDVDSEAVASAREGYYPKTIAAEMSPERLARFFLKEDRGYRIAPELRSMVVFAVQDVLSDPPFSHLDLISCRNLLIYLSQEAQAKVISIFHFALREGGILLLGKSEAVGPGDGGFEVIAKPERLYRRTGHSRPNGPAFLPSFGDGMRIPMRSPTTPPLSRQAGLADLCRRLIIDTYAPAAVLINHNHECLYSLGPTDRYFRMAPGHPTHDLLALARESIRTKLRSAIQKARLHNTRIVVPCGQVGSDTGPFTIDIQPVAIEGENLLLICFVELPKLESSDALPIPPDDGPRLVELERELSTTRAELLSTLHDLDILSQEHKAMNEEALSVNEEYQITNEEMLTSKEELQSLNEELTALNSQLHESLERQRTTSNDLKNVLYSTHVATVFLDTNLNIRLFTPATKALFNVIPSDIGRPLSDLNSLAADSALLADAQAVLQTLTPIEREIEGRNGAWYLRRILPYRAQGDRVEGVVITFADMTERRHVANALEMAERQAQRANAAKSRFLAAASHDLRQPLQTLALVQGLLTKIITEDKARSLVVRLGETLDAMTGMLNTLLDINQIEAGEVCPNMVSTPLNGLLTRMREEFSYHAQARNLSLRVVPCGLSILSDPRLLEPILRNLLANAVKYTPQGKVLLGCRRHEETLCIEIWDTGIGIPDTELQTIFEEYHQLDNAARERSRGLGLGLSIVRRLGKLLGHRIRVRSQPGKGSVFSVEVKLMPSDIVPEPVYSRQNIQEKTPNAVHRTGNILVIEDDPEIRDLMGAFLKDDGYRVTMAPDGAAAVETAMHGAVQPDVILTDYTLPYGMNGLQLIETLREKFHHSIPAIILTGDTAITTLPGAALRNGLTLNKPVKLLDLSRTIQRLLIPPAPEQAPPSVTGEAVIFIVDDDPRIREALRCVLEDDGLTVEDYADCEAFLAAYRPGPAACLLIDAILPGMNGFELLDCLRAEGHRLPAIMITGNGDVPMAVQAMKAGAADFIEKPVGHDELLASIARALEQARDSSKRSVWHEIAASHVSSLTSRQRQIMKMVLAGHPSKNIAADLGISQRTVENHRASIMKKTGSKSLPALARLAVAAAWNGEDSPLI